MPTCEFTDKALDSFVRNPPREMTEYRDTKITGLSLRVLPSGTATFSYVYRLPGAKLQRQKIGRYPDISLKDAREKARASRRETELGNDPAAERRKARTAARFEELALASIRASRQGDERLPAAGQLDARAFNVGTSVATSVNVLATELLRVSEREVPVHRAPARPGEMQQSFLDVSKAKQVLGWRPSVSLADGLGRTFRWFAERRVAANA